MRADAVSVREARAAWLLESCMVRSERSDDAARADWVAAAVAASSFCLLTSVAVADRDASCRKEEGFRISGFRGSGCRGVQGV